MNTAVEKALRALAEAEIGDFPKALAGEESGAANVGTEGEQAFREESRPGEPLPQHTRMAGPCVPDAVLTSRYPLAEICRATLDANPAACKLSADERRWLAEYLEAAVLNWLRRCFEPERAWDATCPKGHRVAEGIFAKVLMGWCCGGLRASLCA